MLFAPGDRIRLRVHIDDIPEQPIVCKQTVEVPTPAPTEPMPQAPQEPEAQESSQPSFPTNLNPGCTSPNGWYVCWQEEDGQIWVEDGQGLVHSSEISGTNPSWLGNWAILAYHPDGGIFLTDMWGSFVRELRVVGEVTTISLDGEWVQYQTTDGESHIVSIHGARYGEGEATSPLFAYVVFPDSPGP
jgi:hypothetical protein